MTNSFSPARYADWLAQVQKDLKDPQAPETLRWYSPEGFTVEPYYAPEQVGALPLDEQQTAQPRRPGWLNTPVYRVGVDERSENEQLRDAVANGADALWLHVPATVNLARLLQGIKLSETPVYFSVMGSPVGLLEALQQIAPYQLRGGITGTAPVPATELNSLLETAQYSQNFRVIHINGLVFHNAGATAAQEIAFTLAQLVESFDALTEMGREPHQLAARTVLRVGVGTSYFVEMAKLRALRVLLARCASAYPFAASSLLIHGVTSAFYEAAATPYTNLLRGTTEAMAGVMGGCDLLTVRPYDASLNSSAGHPTAFSQRIARNVSTMLRDESQLGRVADPAAGSYYIETLTHQLAEAAWSLFLDVEKRGGLTEAAAFVRDTLDAAYAAKVAAVQQGRVLVGVTKFRHDEGDAVAPAGPVDIETQTGWPARRLATPFE